MNDKLRPALVIGALMCIATAVMAPIVAIGAALFLAIRYALQWRRTGDFPPFSVFATSMLGGGSILGLSWAVNGLLFQQTFSALAGKDQGRELMDKLFAEPGIWVAVVGLAVAVAIASVLVISIGAALVAYGLPSLERPKPA